MFDNIFINTILVLTIISFNLAIYMWAIREYRRMELLKHVEFIMPKYVNLISYGLDFFEKEITKAIKSEDKKKDI